MAKTLQLRRGTTAQNDAFTGAVGELSVDTTKKTLRLHDGTTKGGKEIIGKSDLATVATSGSYADLSNKPTVDSSLSTTSTNAVQNKVVKSSIDTLTTSVNAKLPLAGGNITGSLSIGGVEVVPVANNAAAHNGIYRGANLAQWYTIEQLSTKVQAGDWSNLFIGDYYDITMTTSYKSNETVRWQIAGFDTEYGHGSTMTSVHHLAMIPRDCFDTYQKMNSTNTTEGGYSGSDMAKTVLPIYASALKTAIGESHVLTRQVLRSNAVTTTVASGAYAGWSGASSGWAWVNEDLGLLSEVQVYGSRVLSSSFYDVGNFNKQLPIFALGQDLFVSGPSITSVANQSFSGNYRCGWLLSSVVSSTAFASVYDRGYAAYAGASVAGGVRPLFLFH